MSDFFQSKSITTLQSLCINAQMESELIASDKKIVVVVPCSIRHFRLGTLHQLIEQLQAITFLHSIVVVLSGPEAETEKNKNEPFQSLGYRHDLITVLCASEPGKGRALKVGFNYVYQQHHDNAVVVTLDADLQSFNADFLLKLAYPVAVFGGHFNTGYYVRYSNNKLDGRLTRLLVFPMLYAMSAQDPGNELLQWLLAFRYPLSGDVALSSQLLPKLVLADHWAYDVSLLNSVYRWQQKLDVYQTELSENYEHLHRSVEKDGELGLMEVSRDIVGYLLTAFTPDRSRLAADYHQLARQYCEKYRKLALFNGLTYSQEAEDDLIKRIYSQIAFPV
jgi:glucosyl-3-phosphoglycerate synthase